MKYSRLTVLFKNNPEALDDFDGGTHAIDYHNCTLMVAGEHLIIAEHSEDGATVEAKIFPIKTISSYKTYFENGG